MVKRYQIPTFFRVPADKRMLTPARPVSYSRLPEVEIVFAQTEPKSEDTKEVGPSEEVTELNLAWQSSSVSQSPATDPVVQSLLEPSTPEGEETKEHELVSESR